MHFIERTRKEADSYSFTHCCIHRHTCNLLLKQIFIYNHIIDKVKCNSFVPNGSPGFIGRTWIFLKFAVIEDLTNKKKMTREGGAPNHDENKCFFFLLGLFFYHSLIKKISNKTHFASVEIAIKAKPLWYFYETYYENTNPARSFVQNNVLCGECT